jgi:hypothetical protein
MFLNEMDLGVPFHLISFLSCAFFACESFVMKLISPFHIDDVSYS